MTRLLWIAALVCACGTSGGSVQPPPGDAAEPGHECPGATVPLKGACVAVGVPGDDCGAGFVADGEGGCKPRLPNGCSGRELAVLGEGACRRVGVVSCAKGFRDDGEGGCTPILPATPCAPGTFAIPGEVACHEPSPCTGEDPWGELLDDPSALYVDGAHTGTADGSRARPYPTLAAAIASASSTAPTRIHLAPGTYDGTYTGSKELELHGRCARRTIVTGEMVSSKALAFIRLTRKNGRAGTNTRMRVIESIVGEGSSVNAFVHLEIRASLFEGPSLRAAHVGGASAVIEASAFRDVRPSPTGDAATLQLAGKDGAFTITDTLIETSAGIGVRVDAGTAQLTRTVIRDTKPTARWGGAAIRAMNEGTRVTLEDSTIQGASHAAVSASHGASVSLSRTTIRDVASGTESGVSGAWGVLLACGDTCGTLEVRDSVIGRGLGDAIESHAATVIERSILGPTLRLGGQGNGLRLEPDPATPKGARARVTNTLALQNPAAGFELAKMALELTDCESRNGDNPECPLGSTCGAGIGTSGTSNAMLPTVLDVRGLVVSGGRRGAYLNWTQLARLDRVVVTGAREVGLYAYASELDVSHAVVLGAADAAGDLGAGIAALSAGTPFSTSVVRSKLTARTSTIVGAAVAGVAVLGSDATIERCAVRGTRPRADGKFGDGIGVMHYPVEDAPATASATVHSTLVTSNARVGVSVFGATLAIERTRASCNPLALNAQALEVAGAPRAFSMQDLGDNACGCRAPEGCRVDVVELEPIDPRSFVKP